MFPYETVDRLHDAHHTTGPVCVLRIQRDDGHCYWEPFGSENYASDDAIVERSILKNLAGNQILFESRRHGLGLVATQRWTPDGCLGHVRTVTIRNESDRELEFDLLDGLRNIMPCCVDLGLQQSSSCLVNAYKRCDIDAETNLGLFSLSSQITDTTEPTEALRVNVVWQVGLADATVSLSSESLRAFRSGVMPKPEPKLTGQRGNYFVSQQGIALGPQQSLTWHVVADAGLDHLRVVALREALREGKLTPDNIETAVERARVDLLRLIGTADGLQETGSARATIHHFANTTFNSMRGGLFVDNHLVPANAFCSFVAQNSAETYRRHEDFLNVLGARVPVADLLEACRKQQDNNLVRLCYEFLPLTFSRRHGDPSRPWNRFAIRVHDDDGKKVIHYEGNWRDIFQNWESTCTSFPQFFPGAVARFVNGSTPDGFNPYRVTSEGFEWEVPNEDEPWSHYGYWGDHQIVYLSRLIEALDDHAPAQLQKMLVEDCFAYLQVPYRLKPYGELVRDRRNTIVFDKTLDAEIQTRVADQGEDGKLLRDGSGDVYLVNLLEKLVVPALSKASNLVIGGGIWMNTQRPEWNDANNALVGNGVSVVTLAHLYRYCRFMLGLCQRITIDRLPMSREVSKWMHQVIHVLEQNIDLLQGQVGDTRRRKLLDELGEAFSDYRTIVYDHGFSKRLEVERLEIERFFELVCRFAEQTLLENERPDGLFHAYNLLDFANNGSLPIKHLYEMLEGQVAAITSGALSIRRVITLVEQLFDSRMYREDQHTFMLYPAVDRNDFLHRNVIPEPLLQKSTLLTELVRSENQEIVGQDAMGVYRFHGDLSTAADLRRALDCLAQNDEWAQAVTDERDLVQQIYAQVFQHHAFTGRSGTMYAYEGIGSIYWHMVSKLLLAIQETVDRAAADGETAEVLAKLRDLYFRVRRGLCFEKSAGEYGAFPTDPYSHSPAHAGAEQPGMTGQVKEGILLRWGELGVQVDNGCVRFEPRLLKDDEYLTAPSTFSYVRLDGQKAQLELSPDELAFTYCQVPVVYGQASQDSLTISWRNGRVEELSGNKLSDSANYDLLGRLGQLESIRVNCA